MSAQTVPIAVPVGRVQERQSIESFVHHRRVRRDPPEGIGAHAEAGRHVHAFDPRQLAEPCPLPPDRRRPGSDRSPADSARHRSSVHPFLPAFAGSPPSLRLMAAPTAPVRAPACIVSRSVVLAASPPPACMLLTDGMGRALGAAARGLITVATSSLVLNQPGNGHQSGEEPGPEMHGEVDGQRRRHLGVGVGRVGEVRRRAGRARRARGTGAGPSVPSACRLLTRSAW